MEHSCLWCALIKHHRHAVTDMFEWSGTAQAGRAPGAPRMMMTMMAGVC
jgi:hypothetical protein